MDKKKIRVIINPKSGAKKKKKVINLLYKYLDNTKYDFEICYTEAPKHARFLSKEAKSLNFDIVAVIGGDGTINEVVPSLINSNIKLGIIPTGSGNGIARSLKIPMNLKKAILRLNHGSVSEIDLVKINQEYFMGIAGIGFDAYIAHEFSKCEKRGFFTYAKLVINKFKKYKSKPLELIIDGKKVLKEGFLFTFAKASQYGNNIKIAPEAKMDDGYIYLSILKFPKPLDILKVLFQLLNGTIYKSKYFESIKCKNIQIIDNKIRTHFDGEALFFENKMDLSPIHKAIKVIV